MNDIIYTHVADITDIEPGQGLRRIVNGHAIAIFNVDGAYHTIDDLCTHADASLADGWLDGREIECPLHQGRFDVTCGRATAAPCVIDVATYLTRVEDGHILVAVPH